MVKPVFGIKTNWVTEITHIKEKAYCVDEQRVGPYSMWHHQHIIEQQGDQVLMKDIVSYQPPFGWLGIIPLVSGIAAFCPIYAVLGLGHKTDKKQ